VVKALREIGYDGTVTLEIHSPELHHLEVSRQLWRKWWDAA
jgi:sugar phosphate isomerase/epimerase